MIHPYYCAYCGDAVQVSVQGEITRTCGHHGQTVIAERTSILYGEGGAGERSLLDRAWDALGKLAKALR